MTQTWITGKAVLVTGAAGTVGTELIRELLRANPRVVRALDCHEHGLFELEQTLGSEPNVRYLLGDIREPDRLRRALRGIDIVFHTAALKHVSIGEYNPFEVVRTNLMGLENVIEASLAADVEQMIFTSSDKAVNPTNAMGASKLMGERLVSAANGMRGPARTRFASVRFGNILGSNGSVVSIFRRQIVEGGPVTITDPEMTRFVMGLSHAVRLVLRAGELCQGGEVFVLKMPSLRIVDLAAVMIEELARTCGREPKAIPVTTIGSKPGEKLFEELLSRDEAQNAAEDHEVIVYRDQRSLHHPSDEYGPYSNFTPVTSAYQSDKISQLSKSEISQLLVELGILGRPSTEVDRCGIW